MYKTSFYKLVQFFKYYLNQKRMKNQIEIKLRIVQNQVDKLRYEYKYICKDIFINKYEYLNMVEDRNNYLTRMKDLKPYIIKFKENGKIKPKIYLFDCIIERYNW